MNKLKKHHAVMPQSALLSHVQRHLHKGPVLPASPPNLDAADDAGWKIVENQLWKNDGKCMDIWWNCRNCLVGLYCNGRCALRVGKGVVLDGLLDAAILTNHIILTL